MTSAKALVLLSLVLLAGCQITNPKPIPSTDVETSQIGGAIDRVEGANTKIQEQAETLKKETARPEPHVISAHSDVIAGEVVTLRENKATLETKIDNQVSAIDKLSQKIEQMSKAIYARIFYIGFAIIFGAVLLAVLSKGAYLTSCITVVISSVATMALAATFRRFEGWITGGMLAIMTSAGAYYVWRLWVAHSTTEKLVKIGDTVPIQTDEKIPTDGLSKQEIGLVTRARKKYAAKSD